METAPPAEPRRRRLSSVAKPEVAALLEPFRVAGFDLRLAGRSWIGVDRSRVELRLAAEVVDSREGGTAVGFIDRLVEDRDAFHRSSLTYEPFRGRGVGRRLLAATVAFYDRLGVERVRTTASGAGRYAWARCGFDFEENVIAALKGTPPALKAARALAARLGFDLGSAVHAWEIAGRAEHVRPGALAGLPGGTLGRILLLCSGTDAWNGVLDLALSSPGREQLERYCAPASPS